MSDGAPERIDDDRLLAGFEDLSLPREAWTHRAHVRVAWLYLSRHPFDEALDRMRRGILAFNAAKGVPDTPTSGYDETTTVAFMRLVHVVMLAYGDAFPVADSEQFCDAHPQLLTKHILRLFYSPERRMHPEAKRRFVEPDLAPLPVVGPEARYRADSPDALGQR